MLLAFCTGLNVVTKEGFTGCLDLPLCAGPLGVVNGCRDISLAGSCFNVCFNALPCIKLLTGSLSLGAFREGVT